MDNKLRKLILEFLFSEKKATSPYKVREYCCKKCEVPEKDFKRKNEVEQQVNHLMDVLVGEGLVGFEEYQTGQLSGYSVWLTANGYKEFDPFYKKAWQFFQGPFLTVLTIVNTIISIAAVIVGWILLTK
jgi:hypothetical protein